MLPVVLFLAEGEEINCSLVTSQIEFGAAVPVVIDGQKAWLLVKLNDEGI